MDNESTATERILLTYIQEVCLPHKSNVSLSFDGNLFETGIVDSAGLISFICFIEKEFGITIPDQDLLPANFVSITSIANYIRAHNQVHHESH